MGSTRLPGKVLADIGGMPMVIKVAARASKAATLDQIIVATTIDPSDDPVEAACAQWDIPCFRGSRNDVLDRFYQAALQFGARTIVRLTADCPLIDPKVIDLTVMGLLGYFNAVRKLSGYASSLDQTSGETPEPQFPGFNFACTRLPPPWNRSFPIGLDVEACHFADLERAWEAGASGKLLPHHREHVMPYFYEEVRSNHYRFTVGEQIDLAALRADAAAFRAGAAPVRINSARSPDTTATEPNPFNVLILDHHPNYGSHRWTVDTPEDLQFLRQVFARLQDQDNFNWYEVLNLVEQEPDLESINLSVKHKDYREVDAS